MKTMKAAVLSETRNLDSLRVRETDYPSPDRNEVVIKIKTAALNHRDVWIVKGLYAKIKLPVVPGSDGAGIVHEVGDGVDKSWTGAEVIINPSLNWGINARIQQPDFRILGMPDNGTLAEFVKVPLTNIAAKPHYLSFEEAAAIPLAGLTGYRALFVQGKLNAGETVLITGIGGGVSSLMMQMALAGGALVAVTSGSDSKIQQAVEDGAAGGVNYKKKDWQERIYNLLRKRSPDLIVDSAGGDEFNKLIDLIKPGGRIVFFGATAGNPSQINLRKIFWKQITLQGTTMGNEVDFSNMIHLFEIHRIRPWIDSRFKLNDCRLAFQRMINGEQMGKIVISVD